MPPRGREVAFDQIGGPNPRVPGSRLRNQDRLPPQFARTSWLTEMKPQGCNPVDNLPGSTLRRMRLREQQGRALCTARGELGGHDLVQFAQIPPIGWRSG